MPLPWDKNGEANIGCPRQCISCKLLQATCNLWEGPTDANCSGTHCVTTMPALVPPATLLAHHAEPEICYPQTLSILWGVRGCAWLLKK